MRPVLCAAVLLLVAGSCLAESAKEAAGSYEVVQIGRSICRAKLRNSLLKAELAQGTADDGYREFVGCQLKLEKDAKGVYARVLSRAKSTAARAALKDYQAALMVSIGASDYKSDESDSARRRRQDAADERAEQAWQRLQLEL
jgi:hypothetical protein